MKKQFFVLILCSAVFFAMGATVFASHNSDSALEVRTVNAAEGKTDSTVYEPHVWGAVAKAAQKAYVYGKEAVRYYADEITKQAAMHSIFKISDDVEAGNLDVAFD